MVQVEYHYFHQTNITVPRDMLEVLSGLQSRDLRVFHVEPNYWWHNYAQEFIEFAYVQASAQGHTLHAQWAVCASPTVASYAGSAHAGRQGWRDRDRSLHILPEVQRCRFQCMSAPETPCPDNTVYFCVVAHTMSVTCM